MGSMNSIDANGSTNGEVIIQSCKDDETQCPDFIKVKFYAFDKKNNKELIGEVLADRILKDGATVYSFSFTVPKKYACFTIKAFAVDPITAFEIQIPYSPTFQSASFEEKCDGGGDDNENPPGGMNGPKVEFTDVQKQGRLVQIGGKCAVGASVDFSGDISTIIDNKEACTTGVFKHCNFINKYQNDNNVIGKQTLNGKQATDSEMIKWDSSPIKVITFDTFKVDADEKNITITGKCNPTDKVHLSAYGTSGTSAQADCTTSGTYSIKTPLLIPSLKGKGRAVTGQGRNSVVAGGNSPNIIFDPDTSPQPSCAISQMVANSAMCTKQAATLKGSCMKDLPVHVLVNGTEQVIGYCSTSGSFEIPNVLLKKVGISNEVRIKQVTPYGKSCTDSKTVTTF